MNENPQPTTPQPGLEPQIPHSEYHANKKAFIVAGVLLLVVAIPVSLSLIRSEQDTRQKAAITENSANQTADKSVTDTAIMESGSASSGDADDEIDAIINDLNEEAITDSALDTEETAQQTDITNALTDVEVLSNTIPSDQ